MIGNKPASGTEIIQELGEEHQRTGKWIVYTSADSVFQIAAHEETIPLEELYDGCRVAREILTGKHAVGRVIARPVRRRRRATTSGRRTATTSRSSRAARTTSPRSAPPGTRSTASGRSHDIFAGCDIDESFPTKSNVDGINRTIELLENIDGGLVFIEPRRDRPALGPPQRPGQLPPLPAGLRPAAARHPRGAARRRPADPHLRSRLRPDDAVDRPLARARAAARLRRREERRRADPRGRRVRRRRRDRQRVARREASRARARPAGRSSSGEDQRPGGGRRGSTRPRTNLEARALALRERRRARSARDRVRGGRRGRAEPRARGRRRPGRARRADRGRARLRGRRWSTSRRAWSSSRAPAASTRASATSQQLPFDGRVVRLRRSPRGCSSTSPTSTRARRARPRAATRRTARRRHERRRRTCGSCARSRASAAWQPVFTRENGAEILGRHFERVERRDADGCGDDRTTARRCARFVGLARRRRAARPTSSPTARRVTLVARARARVSILQSDDQAA